MHALLQQVALLWPVSCDQPVAGHSLIHALDECEEQVSYFDSDTDAFKHIVKRDKEGLYANPYPS